MQQARGRRAVFVLRDWTRAARGPLGEALGHWAGHWAIVWAMGRGPAGAPRHTYKMFRKFQIDKSAAGGRGALNYDDARDKVLSRNNILTRQLGTVKMQYQSTFS